MHFCLSLSVKQGGLRTSRSKSSDGRGPSDGENSSSATPLRVSHAIRSWQDVALYRRAFRKWLETSLWGNMWDVMQVLVSILASSVYVVGTYQEGASVLLGFSLSSWESCFLVVFSLDVLVQFVASESFVSFLLRPLTMVDIITLVPLYTTMALEGEQHDFNSAYKLEFVRVVRILRVLRFIRLFRILNLTNTHDEFSLSTTQQVENAAQPLRGYSTVGDDRGSPPKVAGFCRSQSTRLRPVLIAVRKACKPVRESLAKFLRSRLRYLQLDAIKRQVLSLVLTIFIIIFVSAGFYHAVEVIGAEDCAIDVKYKNCLARCTSSSASSMEPWGAFANTTCQMMCAGDKNNNEQTCHEVPSFFTTVFFLIVTITTVGYGDIVPNSTYTRLVISVMIIIAFVVVPIELNRLTELLQKQSRYLSTSFNYASETMTPIVVAGDVNGPGRGRVVQTFLDEFFRREYGAALQYKVIIVGSEDPGVEIEALQLSPRFAGNVLYVRGSFSSERDLERAGLYRAEAVFLLVDWLAAAKRSCAVSARMSEGLGPAAAAPRVSELQMTRDSKDSIDGLETPRSSRLAALNPDPGGGAFSDMESIDATNMLRVLLLHNLALNSHPDGSPSSTDDGLARLRILVQVAQAQKERILHSLGTQDDASGAARCGAIESVAVDKLRMALLGLSTLMPGFAPLFMNLMVTPTIGLAAGVEHEKHVLDYFHGAQFEPFLVPVHKSWAGHSFADFARTVHEWTRGKVFALGVEEKSDLYVRLLKKAKVFGEKEVKVQSKTSSCLFPAAAEMKGGDRRRSYEYSHFGSHGGSDSSEEPSDYSSSTSKLHAWHFGPAEHQLDAASLLYELFDDLYSHSLMLCRKSYRAIVIATRKDRADEVGGIDSSRRQFRRADTRGGRGGHSMGNSISTRLRRANPRRVSVVSDASLHEAKAAHPRQDGPTNAALPKVIVSHRPPRDRLPALANIGEAPTSELEDDAAVPSKPSLLREAAVRRLAPLPSPGRAPSPVPQERESPRRKTSTRPVPLRGHVVVCVEKLSPCCAGLLRILESHGAGAPGQVWGESAGRFPVLFMVRAASSTSDDGIRRQIFGMNAHERIRQGSGSVILAKEIFGAAVGNMWKPNTYFVGGDLSSVADVWQARLRDAWSVLLVNSHSGDARDASMDGIDAHSIFKYEEFHSSMYAAGNARVKAPSKGAFDSRPRIPGAHRPGTVFSVVEATTMESLRILNMQFCRIGQARRAATREAQFVEMIADRAALAENDLGQHDLAGAVSSILKSDELRKAGALRGEAHQDGRPRKDAPAARGWIPFLAGGHGISSEFFERFLVATFFKPHLSDVAAAFLGLADMVPPDEEGVKEEHDARKIKVASRWNVASRSSFATGSTVDPSAVRFDYGLHSSLATAAIHGRIMQIMVPPWTPAVRDRVQTQSRIHAKRTRAEGGWFFDEVFALLLNHYDAIAFAVYCVFTGKRKQHVRKGFRSKSLKRAFDAEAPQQGDVFAENSEGASYTVTGPLPNFEVNPGDLVFVVASSVPESLSALRSCFPCSAHLDGFVLDQEG